MNIRDLNIPELEEKLTDYVNRAERAGQDWAEAKAKYEDFEDKRKPLLAQLKPLEGTVAQKEDDALKSKDWAAYMLALSDIRRDFYRSQVVYDMEKLKIDVLRTIFSTRREEVKRFGA